MNYIPLWRVILMILVIGVGGCATGPVSMNPYFELPPDRLLKAEQELYNRALEKLKTNHPEESAELWKRFLEHNPRSFRGYNNLGMALYSSDQLEKSLTAFETALALEPFDLKIKDNLKRALRFQVTILRENREYDRAIHHLERVKKLSDPPEKEKVALEIETLQDLIFEQVKRVDTLEEYEAFVSKYPNNPKNSDEARRKIAKMKPQEAPIGEFPEMQDEMLSIPGQRPTRSETFASESVVSESAVSESVVSEPMEAAHKETIEIVAQTQQPDEAEEMPSEPQDNEPEVKEAAPPIAMKRPKPAEPMMDSAPDPGMEMKREKSSMASPAPEPMPTKRVRIMTRKTPLRVRESPDSRSRAIAQIPKGTVVPVFQESKGWFQIEYQKGRKGWISKKYTKLVS